MRKFLLILAFFATAVSCSKNDSLVADMKKSRTATESAGQPTQGEMVVTETTTTQSFPPLNPPLFSQYKTQLDMTQVTKTIFEGQGVYVAPFLKSFGTKFYGMNDMGHEAVWTKKIIAGNGSITVTGTGGLMTINVQNNVVVSITDANGVVIHGQIRPRMRGWCQRQRTESYGSCFKGEVDEFCNSAPSCIAVSTNTTIIIMIALACNCYGTIRETTAYQQPTTSPFDPGWNVKPLN